MVGFVCVIFALFANSLYHRKTKEEISAIQRAAHNDSDLLVILQEKGGVHAWVLTLGRWAGWALLVIVIIGILASIVMSPDKNKPQPTAAQADSPSTSANQPEQTADKQIPAEVVSSDEKARLAAQKSSARIKWLYEAKNYEAIVQETNLGTQFFYSDFNYIGLALYNTGRYTQAFQVFLKAEQQFPNDPGIKNNLGNVYYSSGDFKSAITKYAESESIIPNNPIFKSNLASAYYSLGDISEAAIKFHEALVLDPFNHPAQLGLKQVEAAQKIEDSRIISAKEDARKANEASRKANAYRLESERNLRAQERQVKLEKEMSALREKERWDRENAEWQERENLRKAKREQDKIENARLEKEKTEQAKLAKEKYEAERPEREKREQEMQKKRAEWMDNERADYLKRSF